MLETDTATEKTSAKQKMYLHTFSFCETTFTRSAIIKGKNPYVHNIPTFNKMDMKKKLKI